MKTKDEVRATLRKWRWETNFQSNPTKLVSNRHAQEILSEGVDVIPTLLELLSENFDRDICFLLSELTDNPKLQNEDTSDEVSWKWIVWGEEKYQRAFQNIQQIDLDFHPETGAMQFGDDWPGFFIRGDNAIHFGMQLQRVLKDLLKKEPQDFELMMIQKQIRDMLQQINRNVWVRHPPKTS